MIAYSDEMRDLIISWCEARGFEYVITPRANCYVISAELPHFKPQQFSTVLVAAKKAA